MSVDTPIYEKGGSSDRKLVRDRLRNSKPMIASYFSPFYLF